MDQKNKNANVNKDKNESWKDNPTKDTDTGKPKIRDTEFSREIFEVPEKKQDKESDSRDEENPYY